MPVWRSRDQNGGAAKSSEVAEIWLTDEDGNEELLEECRFFCRSREGVLEEPLRSIGFLESLN